MKRIFLILMLFSFLGFSQEDNLKLFLNYNGFISESDSTNSYVVLNYSDKTKDELYKTTLVCLNELYNSPKDVITTVEGESITINALLNSISTTEGLYDYDLYYSCNLRFKDNKIRFEVSIKEMFEKFIYSETKKPFFVANTDSNDPIEINCVWMKNKEASTYFLYRKELKDKIDIWVNGYIKYLQNCLKNNDW